MDFFSRALMCVVSLNVLLRRRDYGKRHHSHAHSRPVIIESHEKVCITWENTKVFSQNALHMNFDSKQSVTMSE